MSESIIIPIESDSRKAVNAWEQTIQKMEEAEKVAKRVNSAMSPYGPVASRSAAGLPGRTSGSPQAPPIADPFQAQRAFAPGTRQFNQAQRMINRGQGSSFADRLNKLAYSTRIGGNVMPLVGDIANLLGLGKFAGPVGVAAAAVAALGQAAVMASERLGGIGRTSSALGSTPEQLMRTERIGSAAGKNPEEAAADADRLVKAVQTGGRAQAFANEQGIPIPLPGGLGNQNKADFFNKFMQKIAYADKAKRLRLLDEIGLSDYNVLGDMDERHRRWFFRDEPAASPLDSANAAGESGIRTRKLQNYKDALLPVAAGGPATWIWNKLGDPGGEDAPSKGGTGSGIWERIEKVLQDVSKSNWELSTAIDGFGRVISNSNPRAEAAIPPAAQGQAVQDYIEMMRTERFRLGALRGL